MTDISDRKRSELTAKLAALRLDLVRWIAQSELGKPLEKHHTQIRRIDRHLSTLCAMVDDRLASLTVGADVLGKWRAVESQVMIMHRLWGFFRDKLAQRSDDLLLGHLRVADELAWHCYKPVQLAYTPVGAAVDAAGAIMARREPPLVFFSGQDSPFALSRDRPYQVDGVQSTGPLKSLLDRLPVPVIGVPYSQCAHLPDTLVVAHEVGHAVEHDFGLTSCIDSAVEERLRQQQVPDVRRQAWQSWLGEVFADFYGTLCLGAAFVGSLLDVLAAAPVDVESETRAEGNWGAYPTTWLRIELCLEALEQQAASEKPAQPAVLVDALKRLQDEWDRLYKRHSMTAYSADVPHIVAALREAVHPTLGQQPLPKVLCFAASDQATARQAATDLLDGNALDTSDVRLMFAAARLAYEGDPSKLQERNGSLRQKMLAAIADGVRSSAVETPSAGEDAAAAALLFASL